MGSVFLSDLLSGHEPGRSAAIPGRSNARVTRRPAAGWKARAPRAASWAATFACHPCPASMNLCGPELRRPRRKSTSLATRPSPVLAGYPENRHPTASRCRCLCRHLCRCRRRRSTKVPTKAATKVVPTHGPLSREVVALKGMGDSSEATSAGQARNGTILTPPRAPVPMPGSWLPGRRFPQTALQ